MATEILPINSADAVRVVQVALVVSEDPAVQAALVVPEDPAVPVAQAALVVSEDPVAPAVPEGLGEPAVPEGLGEPAVRAALVVPEDLGEPAVRAALVVSESPAVPVALARGHPRARLAVALRTKSVIAAHRPDLVVPLLEAGEDLAVAVVETTREPAAAEAAPAWEAADTVAVAVAADTVAAAAAAVTEPEAVVTEAVAVGDVEDKRNHA